MSFLKPADLFIEVFTAIPTIIILRTGFTIWTIDVFKVNAGKSDHVCIFSILFPHGIESSLSLCTSFIIITGHRQDLNI